MRTAVRHFLSVMALTAVILTVIFGYFAYNANTPVTVSTVELPADQENLINDIKVIAPELAVDKVRTIDLLRQSCGDLSLSEQEIKKNFIERFSNGSFVMSPAHAIIIAAKLRRSGLCG